MHPDEVSDVESLLGSQLAGDPKWRRYNRALKSPLNFVLDRAERQLGTGLSVYWVDNAPADMFCLRGFSEPVVVYNPRYIVHWADVRAALASTVLGPGIREDIAERLSLRLMAELSLSHGDSPEFAACSIIRSTLTSRSVVFLPNTLMSLEHEPISIQYMACWFYGLAHELGHFSATDERVAKLAESLGGAIQGWVAELLDTYELPDSLREQVLAESRSNPRSLLGVNTLLSESLADIFATSLLLESTRDILNVIERDASPGADAPEFNILSFVAEMIMSLNVVTILDRCRRLAMAASEPVLTQQEKWGVASHVIAMEIRLRMVRFYLDRAVAALAFGNEPSAEQESQVTAAIDSIVEELRPAIEEMNAGLGKAMKFALDRDRRASVSQSLQEWRNVFTTDQVPAGDGVTDIEEFCRFAASVRRWSSVFDNVLSIIRDPSKPLHFGFEGSRIYLCPWVKGPDGFNRPFGLDTKHGHIVFVFISKSDLYTQFVQISSEDLAAGYELATTAMLANTEKQLQADIALRLPMDTRIVVAVEGTPDFARYMQELASGDIWDYRGASGAE